MSKIKIALIIFTIFSTNFTSYSQEINGKNETHKFGFNIGYGFQDGLNLDYYYKVILLQAQYNYSFSTSEIFDFELVVQPQYNLTSFKEKNISNDTKSGYEFGLNLGLLGRKYFFDDNLSLYLLLSIGPHYVSGVPERQLPGFIFSDNIFLGVNLKIFSDYYFDLKFGLRHISNASFKQPNGGINNLIIGFGFVFIL